MEEFGGVDVLECLEELVDDILLMNLLENVRPNDGVEIGLCIRDF